MDFPYGLAPNAQAKELGQGLIELGFDPLLVPQKLSSFPEDPGKGSYFGVPFDYLFQRRKSLGKTIGPVLRKIAGIIYSIAASLKLSVYLFKNRKSMAVVFDLSNQTLPLLIEGITCRLLGIRFVYFLWEEVFTHRVNRQSSIWMRWIHRLVTVIEAPLLYGLALRLPNRLCFLTDEFRSFLKKWGYSDSVLFDFPVVKCRKRQGLNGGNDNNTNRYEIGFDLVFTGTINCEKDDFVTVIQAISMLAQTYSQLVLRIYGKTEGTAKDEIMAVAEKYCVSDRIEFMGFLLDDLDPVRRQALALLVLKRNVSFNRYNFPSRVLEFIDSGRPLLISDLVAHKKHFSDRQNAFVIRDGDVEQLTTAIEMILQQPDSVREMTNRAKELLDDQFSATKNLNRLLSSLELLESSSEPGKL